MMDFEIIYNKQYPKFNISEILPDESDQTTKMSDANLPTFKEMIQRIAEFTSYVLLPERAKCSQQFINTAIEVSELYQMDIVLLRLNSHITAEIAFDGGISLHGLKPLFSLSDDYSVFTNIGDRDITISFDYYTHAVVRGGRVIMPPDITRPEG